MFFLLSETFAAPVLAANYNSGVKANDYVKYGVHSINQPPQNVVAWEKTQVLSSSGNDVTWRMTGQMKSGSAIADNGSTFFINLKNGATNYTHDPLGPIIAANLNKGDRIYGGISAIFEVNSSEVRTFVNVSRPVNVVVTESLYTTLGGLATNATTSFVYDKISGILLENEANFVFPNSTHPDMMVDIYAVETNIFSSRGIQNPISILYYVVTAAIIAAICASVIILKRSKHSGTKPSAPKKNLTELVESLANVKPGECYLSDSLENCVKILCEMHSRGTKALAIVREDPTILTKTCNLQPDEVILLSSKSIKNYKALSTLQEISIAVMKFIKTGGGVVLLEGLEYLISRFGFNAVFMCLQETKIEFLEAGAVLLIPLNLETLDTREKAQLLSELKLI